MKFTRRAVLMFFVASLSVGSAAGRKRWQKYNATAYAVDGETASGAQTKAGRTVAGDPDVLPLGTKIQVKGAGPYSGVYMVHDSGRKIQGREIDIFMDSAAEAKKFGKKQVMVRVLRFRNDLSTTPSVDRR